MSLVAHMRRRKFITLLGGAAVAWPLAARAQQSAMSVIGYLGARSRDYDSPFIAAFIRGLNETGYTEGRNVAIEYRWADSHADRLPALATELVQRRVDIIFASSSGSAVAAKAATQIIPIVFAGGSDPVHLGLVASLNRPGSNVTGVTTFSHMISAKRLEFLHQLVPNLPVIALLVNPSNPSARTEVEELQAAARALSLHTVMFNARTANDIDVAFTALVQQQVGALVATADPLFTTQRHQLGALATRHAIATMYPLRELVEAGGLISYGASFADVHRHAGIYAARILKGEKPTDLPVELPTQFTLIINVKTAKTLGLDVPPKLLALADEVIE